MKKAFYVFRDVLIFLILTVVTQIGGIIFLLVKLLAVKFSWNPPGQSGKFRHFSVVFIMVYLVMSMAIVPILAPLTGRVPLPWSGPLRPHTHLTWLLNRQYVTPQVYDLLTSSAAKLQATHPGWQVRYLDANFPFINRFPLWPHLSHSDGKKVDLAYFYDDKSDEKKVAGPPSLFGYGVYDGPTKNELNQPAICEKQGYWQYGLIGNFVLPWKKGHFFVNAEATGRLIRALADDERTSKIFIEPHLKKRWRLDDLSKVRYQGCRAVRHDDHIHIEIF